MSILRVKLIMHFTLCLESLWDHRDFWGGFSINTTVTGVMGAFRIVRAFITTFPENEIRERNVKPNATVRTRTWRQHGSTRRQPMLASRTPTRIVVHSGSPSVATVVLPRCQLDLLPQKTRHRHAGSATEPQWQASG